MIDFGMATYDSSLDRNLRSAVVVHHASLPRGCDKPRWFVVSARRRAWRRHRSTALYGAAKPPSSPWRARGCRMGPWHPCETVAPGVVQTDCRGPRGDGPIRARCRTAWRRAVPDDIAGAVLFCCRTFVVHRAHARARRGAWRSRRSSMPTTCRFVTDAIRARSGGERARSRQGRRTTLHCVVGCLSARNRGTSRGRSVGHHGDGRSAGVQHVDGVAVVRTAVVDDEVTVSSFISARSVRTVGLAAYATMTTFPCTSDRRSMPAPCPARRRIRTRVGSLPTERTGCFPVRRAVGVMPPVGPASRTVATAATDR